MWDQIIVDHLRQIVIFCFVIEVDVCILVLIQFNMQFFTQLRRELMIFCDLVLASSVSVPVAGIAMSSAKVTIWFSLI